MHTNTTYVIVRYTYSTPFLCITQHKALYLVLIPYRQYEKGITYKSIMPTMKRNNL